MPRSQLVQEYSDLAKLKKEVYEAEKLKIKRECEHEEEIFKLKKEKLLLEIKLKTLEIQQVQSRLQTN